MASTRTVTDTMQAFVIKGIGEVAVVLGENCGQIGSSVSEKI
jgi:hypothetical protein